ncbi:hypothetical protein GOODEAATRI_000173, partial [Goodea atripinnis]
QRANEHGPLSRDACLCCLPPRTQLVYLGCQSALMSELQRKTALRVADSVCSVLDGGRLVSLLKVCSLTTQQWTIRRLMLRGCYLASCRATISSRCWRQTSNSRWQKRGLCENWCSRAKMEWSHWKMNRTRQTHAYKCTTCHQPALNSLPLLHGALTGSHCSNIRDNI